MKINEVGMGKDVIIEVSKGTNILQFESKSMEIVQDDLLIECVRYNNKVVNLASKNVVVSVTVDENPLPVKFSDVDMSVVKKDGELYHRVRTAKDGREVNRRESFRVFIGEPGLAQINENTKTRDVLVKDISTTGFAIVSDDDLDINTNIRLSFIDKGTQIILQGCVVRKEYRNNRVIYGCKLVKAPKGLGNYLARKQRKHF